MLDRPEPLQQSDSSRLLLRLARDFGREHAGGYALSAVLLGLIAFANISAAALLKPVLNGMVSADKFGEMRWMALEVLGLFVLRGAATYGSMLTLSRIGNRIVATAQRRAFDRLLNQSVIFFQDRHSSEFIARLALAANGVRDTLQLVVQGGARDALTVAGLIAVMIVRDPVIAVGALCALPILTLLVGRIIRKTSLDELPQLFNVLKGEMSLVGPRPHAVGMKTGETESAKLVAQYAHRHRMKPGMTGWAAIKGSRGPVDTPEAVRRRVALDIEYIEHQSLMLDLSIMALTIPCLLGDDEVVR